MRSPCRARQPGITTRGSQETGCDAVALQSARCTCPATASA